MFKNKMFKLKCWLLDRQYDTAEKKNLPLYKLSFLELQKKYEIIDDYDYEIECNRISDKDTTIKKVDELNIKRKYNKISDVDYYKQYNDLYEKPWVALKTKYEEDLDPDNMEIEVEYNKTFISNMRKKGLNGNNDDEIVEQWLNLFLMSNLDDEDLSLLIENAMDSHYDNENIKRIDKNKLIKK